MNNAVKNGRAPKKSVSCGASPAPSYVMLCGALICTAFLAISLSGAPKVPSGLDEANAAVMSSLAEHEAVAVFLGLDTSDKYKDAVPVMAGSDGNTPDDIYIEADDGSWSLWGYFSKTVGKLFSSLIG